MIVDEPKKHSSNQEMFVSVIKSSDNKIHTGIFMSNSYRG